MNHFTSKFFRKVRFIGLHQDRHGPQEVVRNQREQSVNVIGSDALTRKVFQIEIDLSFANEVFHVAALLMEFQNLLRRLWIKPSERQYAPVLKTAAITQERNLPAI